MMIELFFVACLAGKTPDCQERSLLYVDMPMTTCMLQAQGELAQWSESYPQWTVRRWGCRQVRQGQRGA